MPSVLGLLEPREKKVREEVAQLREEVERVQAALAVAEDALERLAGARGTVAEVLAEAPAGDAGSARGVMAGSVVPHRAAGGMRAKQIALVLGWDATPARVEGVRGRVKRLVARGWATEVEPRVFGAVSAVSAAG